MQIVEGPALQPGPQTLLEILEQTRKGGLADAERKYGWEAVRTMAGNVAAWLQAREDPGPVALVGDPSIEWKILEFGILMSGQPVVAVYPTLHADQIQAALEQSKTVFAFVQDEEVAEQIRDIPFRSFDLGFPEETPEPVDIQPDSVATIFFTSGTTGEPKGVPLTHRNWATSTHANVQGLHLDDLVKPSLLAFLPTAHVAGYASLWAITSLDGWIHFSTPKDMATDFQRVRPTLLLAVPRLYERILRKVDENVGDGLKRRLFQGAYAAAVAMGQALEDGGTPSAGLRLRHGFWSALVLKKLRRLLGFDHVQMGLTGAAAVRPEILYFLQGMGIKVVEAYGMSETCGLVTSNHFNRFKGGSVGTPMPGNAVAIAEDGEILLAGPTIFTGYLEVPGDLMEAEGRTWIQTGDIGHLDDDGFLFIVDRKKEIEVLDTGKNVAPVRVEEAIKGASNYVEDACVIGSGQKFVTALIQPSYDMLHEMLIATGESIPESDVQRAPDPTGQVRIVHMAQQWLEHPKVTTIFDAALTVANGTLSSFEHVRKFRLVPQAWTVAGGELTPTFKKKRRAILDGNQPLVTAMAA